MSYHPYSDTFLVNTLLIIYSVNILCSVSIRHKLVSNIRKVNLIKAVTFPFIYSFLHYLSRKSHCCELPFDSIACKVL